MPNSSRNLFLAGIFLILLFASTEASADYADPPGRVARLDDTMGEVSYSPAGEDEWFSAVRNRPLIRGDRLWTDFNARAEFQVGSAAIRLGSYTSLGILNLSDTIAQLEITQGTLNLSVRHMYAGQIIEVDTPALAFSIDRAGRYRIDVDPQSNATTIVVWKGAGTAFGENANFPMRASDKVRFYNDSLLDYDLYVMPYEDDFDRYCLERDRRLARAISLNYIGDDVVGYADLDEYGSWRPVSGYGTVWFPAQVGADWAPYRDGYWVWQEPWGWTWVDFAPWAFAPSHYGRWVHVSNRWGWVPGPRRVRPVYAPALVAFVGDRGWSLSLSVGSSSRIGWFPLGPRDVYMPSYRGSRDYFRRVNVNNTVISTTTITNVYNYYSSDTIIINRISYTNRTVGGAVTSVSTTVFVNAQPVRPAMIHLGMNAFSAGEITRAAPIAPNVRSVIGAGETARSRPSREVFEHRVFARNAPPPRISSFVAREQLLQEHPGQPPSSGAVSRNANATSRIRVIGNQREAVDARAAGSRRSAASPSATPGQTRLQQTERTNEPGAQARDKSSTTQRNTQQQEQRQVDIQQQRQRRRETDSTQKAIEQQQRVERQRQTDMQQRQHKATPQVIDQQPMERRQRQVETQQQRQAAPPQQEQQQSQTVKQQGKTAKTAKERLAECERQAIHDHRDPKECSGKSRKEQDSENQPRNNRKHN